MPEELSFGIGCFHFGIKKTPPFKYTGAEYIKELRKALESIPSIDNVDFDYAEEFEALSVDIEEEVPSVEKGQGFFPMARSMLRMEFDLYIPLRIQEQLARDRFLNTFTEKFRVSICSAYHSPVTFVVPIMPSRRPNPSDAVVVVRKFLEQEFKSDYSKFESLGPSPFHADCYVRPKDVHDGDEGSRSFEAMLCPQRGYNDVVLYFDPEVFSGAEQATDAIMDEVLDELGFFYSIMQVRSMKIDAWLEIQKLVDRLLAIQQTKGIRGLFKRVFTGSRLINEAFTRTVQFQAMELFDNNSIQESYSAIYQYTEGRCFQPYIDEQIKGQYKYPTKEISQLINFAETKKVKSIERLVVLIAALLGGAIGALITILLAN